MDAWNSAAYEFLFGKKALTGQVKNYKDPGNHNIACRQEVFGF